MHLLTEAASEGSHRQQASLSNRPLLRHQRFISAIITKPLFTLRLSFLIVTFSCVLTIWGAGRTCCVIRRLGVACVQGCLQSLQLFGHFRQLNIQLLQMQSHM